MEEELFDVDKLYLEFLETDSIKMGDNGELIIETEYGQKMYPINRLGKTGDFLSMACRLRRFNYPIGSIEIISNREGKLKIDYGGVNLYQLMKYYNELKKNILLIKEKYDSASFMQYKEEIDYNNIKKLNPENQENLYAKMVQQFRNYLDTLSSEEDKKLQLATRIYNSRIFIAINEMLAIENYKEKSGQELWEKASESSDFESIQGIYDYWKEGEWLKEEEQEMEEFMELIDFSSEESFMESLKNVYKIIDRHKNKILALEDIEVYRGVATDKIDTNKLSKSEVISTSLSSKEAGKFLNRSDKSYKYLSCIFVKKGTPFLMCLTEQGEMQKEIVLIDSAIKIKRMGYVSKLESDIKVDGVPIPCMVYEVEPEREVIKNYNFSDGEEPKI